jgi:hypothetical protein
MGVKRAGFGSSALATMLATAGLVACAPRAQDAANDEHSPLAAPARRSGLWEQTIQRDGKDSRRRGFQICLNKASDDRLWIFGAAKPTDQCRRQITRDAGGAYHFASTCKLGDQAIVTSNGVATGDFVSGYEVRSVLTVSGAPISELDGRHDVQLVARYRGPCPAGMAPGQINLGRGLKIDARRLPQLAFAGA